MSASPSTSSCPTCGEAVAAGGRFCSNCGSPLEEGRSTAVIPPPPDETGPVPVAVTTSEPRLFGVLPPGTLLVVTLAVFALAILSFATGHWALGLVLLGLGLLGLAAFLEAVRRAPDTVFGRRTADAVRNVAGWTGFAAEVVSLRSRLAREVAARRRELWELGARRNELLFSLGDAVYRGDDAAAKAVKARIGELEEEAEQKEREIADAVAGAQERVRRAHLEVQATEMVQVPEPYPPPDEGTPPMPAPVPEPYPPPDEGNPPSEPPVPEPAPPAPEPEEKH